MHVNIMMFVCFFIFIPMVAIAQTVSAEVTDQMIPELAQGLAKAVLEKNYLVLAGIALTLVVWVFKKFLLPRLTSEDKYKQYIPLLTICLSLIAGVGTWLLNPSLGLASILATAFGSTAIASGTWEIVLKPFVNMIKHKKEEIPSPVVK